MDSIRLLLCLLFTLAIGCTPVLNNPPPVAGDDDDSTTGDDDDSTIGDDDDDDDDIVDPTCSNPGTGAAWVTGPGEVAGAWTPGVITIDETAQSVTVTTEVGTVWTWRLGDVSTLWAADGTIGRIWWEQPGLGAWGGDFVFALEANDASFRSVSALVAGRVDFDIVDWGAWFAIDSGSCDGIGVEDGFGCGVVQVLPLYYEVPSWDGVLSGSVSPGEGVGTGDFSIEYHRGVEYLELLCDDVDQLSWSFSMTQWMEIWDG